MQKRCRWGFRDSAERCWRSPIPSQLARRRAIVAPVAPRTRRCGGRLLGRYLDRGVAQIIWGVSGYNGPRAYEAVTDRASECYPWEEVGVSGRIAGNRAMLKQRILMEELWQVQLQRSGCQSKT